ncbi:MAG: hypothetical protein WCJ58_00170 [bacterium]
MATNDLNHNFEKYLGDSLSNSEENFDIQLSQVRVLQKIKAKTQQSKWLVIFSYGYLVLAMVVGLIVIFNFSPTGLNNFRINNTIKNIDEQSQGLKSDAAVFDQMDADLNELAEL